MGLLLQRRFLFEGDVVRKHEDVEAFVQRAVPFEGGVGPRDRDHREVGVRQLLHRAFPGVDALVFSLAAVGRLIFEKGFGQGFHLVEQGVVFDVRDDDHVVGCRVVEFSGLETGPSEDVLVGRRGHHDLNLFNAVEF